MTRKHADGRLDIEYDDGDSEVGLGLGLGLSAFSLRPCHGWSLRSPSHTCSTLGVLGVHGVRGCVGDAADCRRAAVGGV